MKKHVPHTKSAKGSFQLSQIGVGGSGLGVGWGGVNVAGGQRLQVQICNGDLW